MIDALYREDIFQSVREIRPSLAPDGDWTPVVLFDVGDDRTVLLINDYLVDGPSKQLLADKLLPATIRMVKPERAAWIGLAYRMNVAKEEVADFRVRGLQDSNDSRRIEELLIRLCDGEVEELWTATVTRSPDKPPTLAEFEQQHGDPSGRFDGVLLAAMRPLKLVRMLKENQEKGNG